MLLAKIVIACIGQACTVEASYTHDYFTRYTCTRAIAAERASAGYEFSKAYCMSPEKALQVAMSEAHDLRADGKLVDTSGIVL